MSVKKLERNFVQRLFGVCATAKPAVKDCWNLDNGKVTIDLAKAGELRRRGGAIRLAGNGLDVPLLVVYGNDGKYHAFKNACTHGNRSLDPVPGTDTVQCCSIGTSTFSYDGSLIEGPAKGSLTVFPAEVKGQTILIHL